MKRNAKRNGAFQGKKGMIPVPHLKKGTITVPISKGTRNRSLERVPVPGTDPTLLLRMYECLFLKLCLNFDNKFLLMWL